VIKLALRLQIDQRFGEIGLKQREPKTTIKQKPADFNLKQPAGKLNINSNPVKVSIDQTRAREVLNSKDYKTYGKEIAKKGIQVSYKAIATYAQEGDRLAAIEKAGNPIINQAKRHAFGKQKKIKLSWKPGPDYQVNPGGLNINYKLGKLNLKAKLNWPKINSQWGKVKVYQRQLPQLKFKAIDKKV